MGEIKGYEYIDSKDRVRLGVVDIGGHNVVIYGTQALYHDPHSNTVKPDLLLDIQYTNRDDEQSSAKTNGIILALQLGINKKKRRCQNEPNIRD